MAISEVNVDEVDTRGMDPNEDFATVRNRVGDRTIFKNLRTTSRLDLNRLYKTISSLPVTGTIVAAIIRKGPTWLVEKVLVHLFEQLVIVAIIYSNPNQNGTRNLKCFFER